MRRAGREDVVIWEGQGMKRVGGRGLLEARAHPWPLRDNLGVGEVWEWAGKRLGEGNNHLQSCRR